MILQYVDVILVGGPEEKIVYRSINAIIQHLLVFQTLNSKDQVKKLHFQVHNG